MTTSDWLIVAATALSPLIALQVQKLIEEFKEKKSAKRQIFYALMATRATPVHIDRVQALNRIDLEFDQAGRRLDREVISRWHLYADHLNMSVNNANESQAVAWSARSDELFTELLFAISQALGYPFDRVYLRRGIYYPQAHGEAERRRDIFERSIIRVLNGDAPLAMKITELPLDFHDSALDSVLVNGGITLHARLFRQYRS